MSTYDDALIGKAAEAICTASGPVTDTRHLTSHTEFQAARAVLDAVADELRAEAWDEGFDACFAVDGGPVKQAVPNPYREDA